MPKIIVPFLLFCLFFFTDFQKQTPQNDIFQGLKNNNSKSIVKHFSATVNLSLRGESRIYSKFQSELILSDFFQTNKLNSVKIVSSGSNKSDSPYVVYEVKTSKGTYQVLVKFMEIKGELSVVEFIIYEGA